MAAGPVIPDFGEGSDCVTENHTFCTDWVRDNWDAGAAAGPRRAHRADGDRGRRSASRSRSAPRCSRTACGYSSGPSRVASAVDLHDPEPRALPAARPHHRADGDDGRDRARRLHAPDPLPEHPRRAAFGAAGCARGRARDGPDAPRRRSSGWSCRSRCRRSSPGCASLSSRRSRSRRWPRFVVSEGARLPDLRARCREYFKTEIIAAGALAVGLALVADALLVARPARAHALGVRRGGVIVADLECLRRRARVHRRPARADPARRPGEHLVLSGGGARRRARDRAAARRRARPPPPRLVPRGQRRERRPRAAEPRGDRLRDHLHRDRLREHAGRAGRARRAADPDERLRRGRRGRAPTRSRQRAGWA